jgi:hypothetical protein
MIWPTALTIISLIAPRSPWLSVSAVGSSGVSSSIGMSSMRVSLDLGFLDGAAASSSIGLNALYVTPLMITSGRSAGSSALKATP